MDKAKHIRFKVFRCYLWVLYHDMEMFSSNYQAGKGFLLLNVILNTISIIYIFPEYPVKTNCHEHTFLCTIISNSPIDKNCIQA
jgi:hypothetical protein